MKNLLDLSTAKLSINEKENILLASFTGDVKFEDYKGVLLLGAEWASTGKIDSIILDRRHTGKLDAECRVWVKNEYLKKHVKSVVPKVKQVAVVQAKTILGQISGQTVYKTLSMFYPNLTFKSFAKLEDAKIWAGLEKNENPITIKAKREVQKPNKLVVKNRKPLSVTAQILKKHRDNDPEFRNKTPQKKQSSSFFDKVFHALFPE